MSLSKTDKYILEELKKLVAAEERNVKNWAKENYDENRVIRDKWGRYATQSGKFPHNVDLDNLVPVTFNWDEW